ncbi:hypothetical protein [Halorubellus litoreus]|uniref:SH3 domain-containing protein n=1 Tax=Halorubellus litoreus TaxID=755308 RepID=A0ABD5VAE9_9EURY
MSPTISRRAVVLAVILVGGLALVLAGGGFLTETNVTVHATLVEAPENTSPKYTLAELGDDNPVEVASERALAQNGSGSVNTTGSRLQEEGIPQETFFVGHRDQWIRITFRSK